MTANRNYENKSKEIVDLLKEWMERAEDSSWLHARSFTHYRLMNYFFMIPIIVMSSAAGVVNLTNSSVSTSCEEGSTQDRLQYIQLGIGILGVTTAALTAVYNFIKVGEKQQAHAMYSAQFEKLAREIKVETVLSDSTMQTYTDIGVLLKECQDDFDELTDQAPSIPGFIERRLDRLKEKRAQTKMSHLRISL